MQTDIWPYISCTTYTSFSELSLSHLEKENLECFSYSSPYICIQFVRTNTNLARIYAKIPNPDTVIKRTRHEAVINRRHAEGNNPTENKY